MRANGGCNGGCKVCSGGGCQGQSKHRKCQYFGSQKGKWQGEGSVERGERREKETQREQQVVGGMDVKGKKLWPWRFLVSLFLSLLAAVGGQTGDDPC